jgi:hypothetical protein
VKRKLEKRGEELRGRRGYTGTELVCEVVEVCGLR